MVTFAPQKSWADLLADLPNWHSAAQAWTVHLAGQADLAAKLMQFCTQTRNQKAIHP
jgi:hypothetical protein